MASVEYNPNVEYQKFERRSVIMSPKKNRPVFANNLMASPPIKDSRMFPWNWGQGASEIQLSPANPCSIYVENVPKNLKVCSKNEENKEIYSNNDLRRGRPRLDTINSLILEGTSSRSAIRCQVCSRVFPREKSLQAHMRTHTGERPYICDYPDCSRKFAQSGQLKTHQRLHTGEKPFICSEEGCYNRFTHANRHCPRHPSSPLQRNEKLSSSSLGSNNENQSEAVTKWLEKYYADKSDRASTKLRERKMKREFDQQESEDAACYVKTICLEESITTQSSDPESLDSELPVIQESDEKLMGALALIELGAICTVTTSEIENDVASPLDLSCSSS